MEKNRGENCFRFKSGRTDVFGREEILPGSKCKPWWKIREKTHGFVLQKADSERNSHRRSDNAACFFQTSEINIWLISLPSEMNASHNQ